MLAVMTLLSYGCPVQAIVVAFDVDEHTVACWQGESGSQCRRVHEHLVEAGKVALLQVQADEIRVKAVGGVFWLASRAMEVRSRLWLGSVISHNRDGQLIGGLLIRVRASCGPVEKILLVTDGLSSYKSQALKVFREALHTGKVGRPRLVLGTGVMIARVIKRYQRRRVGGGYAACGRGKRGRGDLSGDSNLAIDASVDQHRLHRAPAGHLPRPAGPSGASDPRRGTQALYARSGNVAGGQLLQPLMGTSLSWRGAHPGDGSGAYRSSLVDGGVVDVCGATRRSAQMAWAKAEVAAGGRGCSLTTVQCGATKCSSCLRL